jgi:uncharacterized membrane protein
MNELAEQKVNQYLAELGSNLRPVPLAEREEVLREIAAHIRDCSEEGGSSIETVLDRLGSPQELAAQYRTDTLIRKATGSFSPLLLLRAAGRLATKSAAGFAIFLCGFIGYLAGAGFIITALLKPFLPRLIGLWVGPHAFTFGLWVHGSGGFGIGWYTADQAAASVHEVLGLWYILVALTLGGIFLYLTTLATRHLIRAFTRGRNQASLHWRQTLGTSQLL